MANYQKQLFILVRVEGGSILLFFFNWIHGNITGFLSKFYMCKLYESDRNRSLGNELINQNQGSSTCPRITECPHQAIFYFFYLIKPEILYGAIIALTLQIVMQHTWPSNQGIVFHNQN